MNFPLLETERLQLRPFTGNDSDDLHRHWIDPDVRKYLWDDAIITRKQAAEVVEASIASFAAEGFGFWCVSCKDDPALIGFCGLRRFGDGQEVEALYGIAPEHWGNGLAVEAGAAVLRYGFEQAGLARIYAGADLPNAASFRVMEKLGMVYAHRTTINGLEAIYYAVACPTLE